MANYNIDIGVKVQAQQLEKFNIKLLRTSKLIDNANKSIKNFEKNNLSNVRSINGVNEALNAATINFRKVATGTPQATRAAKEFVKAEELVNKTLAEQEKLLETIRRKQQNKQFTLDIRSQGFKKNQIEQSDGSFLNKRRQELILANRAATLEDRINQTLAKRGKILSANGKQIINNNQARSAGARSGGVGNVLSSAAIGGAFPLLFGQTGAAAVGGGVGGALGGAIGGQFGFALSILGTAIGSFIQQQDELDKSLLKISRSFENAGSSAGFTRASFNELKSTLRMTKDEVLAIATEFARFGEAGESAAFIFGDNPNTFKNLAAIRDTNTLMTAILDTQNGLSIKQQIQLLREAKVTSFKDMQLKLNRMILEENLRREIIEARQITRQEKISDVFKQQLRLIMLIKSFGTTDLEKAFPDFFKTSAEKAEGNVQKIKEEFEELMVELPELQDLLTELDTQVQGMSVSIPSAIDSVSAELKKLTSVAFMVTTVADTVGSAFGESFKGIVKGTMTAQDALRNLFQRTADAFLDMAAQMIAKQIQMKILGIGLNFAGGLFSGGGSAGANNIAFGSQNLGINTASNFPGFADGGRPPVGRASIVGERGPELFVPDRAGTIIPNNAMGGAMNVVVNVDASGSSVEGDEEQANQFGSAIATAIQSELIKQKRPGGLLA